MDEPRFSVKQFEKRGLSKLVRVGRLELPASCSQSKRATNCATPGYEIFQLWSNMWSTPIFDQLPARGKVLSAHNFISGCCAVGSAPALGAGGPGFESPHSDQILQKNRLNRRFFCVLSSVFAILMIAVLRWFWGQKSGGDMSENSRRNRQIPNPSLTGKLPHFLRFYRCRCRPLLIVCLRCVGREAGFLLL